MKIPNKLYQQIIQYMPVACVDLLVTDKKGKVLMLKRKKPPAKGQWWFPGGRVLYFEKRIDAAKRKLKEECGLEALNVRELGTYDLIFDGKDSSECASHAITTVFHMMVNDKKVRLDNQSADYVWKSARDWQKEIKHEFLLSVLRLLNVRQE